MSLSLLVDECTEDRILINRLRQAGHDVQTVSEANLRGQPDHVIFKHAVAQQRILIIYNCADYMRLANSYTAHGIEHPGVILIFSSSNLSFKQIITALSTIENAGLDLSNKYVNLVAYKCNE